MPAPALAVVRLTQQVIDHLAIRRIGRVGNERRNLFRPGRQAGQVKIQTADQHPGIGRGAWLQLRSIESGKDERIARVGPPAGLRDLRRFGLPDWLQRPPVVAAALGRGV